jgi:TrkA-C domain
VLSADGREVRGWITNASVLQAVGSQIGTSPPHAADALDDLRAHNAASEPPDPLPGYQVLEFAVRRESEAAGRTLASIGLPEGSIPVSVLRDRVLRVPDPDLALAVGDRVSVLAPIPAGRVTGSPPGQVTAVPDAADGHNTASLRAGAIQTEPSANGQRGGQRDDGH